MSECNKAVPECFLLGGLKKCVSPRVATMVGDEGKIFDFQPFKLLEFHFPRLSGISSWYKVIRRRTMNLKGNM